MESPRATSPYSTLDVPPLLLEPKKTLAEIVKGDARIYFFSEEDFQYRDQVHRYFDGKDTLAATDGEEFLTVLGVVLDRTESMQCSDSLSDDEDRIEWIDFGSQVLNFINGDQPQDSVAKYYDRLEGSITEKESEEFMRVYEKVKQLCPLATVADSPSSSRRFILRERFDALYFAQEQDFIGWGKVFFTPNSSFESPYRPGNGSDFPTGVPQIRFDLVKEEGPLKFEDYDFVAAGLGDFKEQIIGFHNGTMPNKEGLFEVLQAIFRGSFLLNAPKSPAF